MAPHTMPATRPTQLNIDHVHARLHAAIHRLALLRHELTQEGSSYSDAMLCYGRTGNEKGMDLRQIRLQVLVSLVEEQERMCFHILKAMKYMKLKKAYLTEDDDELPDL